MTANSVKTWFLDGIDFREAPDSLAALEARFCSTNISRDALSHSAKWEPLIRGDVVLSTPGWVPLSDLATTSRGIATGANGFFLMSSQRAHDLGISAGSLKPCVGRANDVSGLVFTTQDFDELNRQGAKCFLLDIVAPPTSNEQDYIRSGEAEGLTSRYILANRKPWFSMEQRAPAAIWAAVFGRGDLSFVHNEHGARSLTNFHSVYPKTPGSIFARALTLALNSDRVRLGARAHTRGYGGGLKKFEPNDLKSIEVPDLRLSSRETLDRMAAVLTEMDTNERTRTLDGETAQIASALVEQAGIEAASKSHQDKLF